MLPSHLLLPMSLCQAVLEQSRQLLLQLYNMFFRLHYAQMKNAE